MSEELMNMEKKMTTDGHSRGFEEDQSRRTMKKEVAKENDKRMSHEEIDKEIIEIKEQLNVLRMILEENQKQGWALRKKSMKWSKLHRRLQQKQVKWQVEELREAELEMEEYICIPEQGEILGEDEDWSFVKDLMNHMKDSEQQGDRMTKASSETTRSYAFKTDSLCMTTGIARERKAFEDIFRIDEDLEVKGDKENFSKEE